MHGSQAYSDSKLHLTALAFAVARRWPHTRANAVDPGWVPTRMGGPAANDDLDRGHRTQVWLATSTDPAALATGRYWYHLRQQPAAPAANDTRLQDELLDHLHRTTQVQLPSRL